MPEMCTCRKIGLNFPGLDLRGGLDGEVSVGLTLAAGDGVGERTGGDGGKALSTLMRCCRVSLLGQEVS